MKIKLETGDWATLGSAAMQIRTAVFVEEQGVPAELEHDEADAVSLHALARNEAGQVLGTGRLLQDGHIGRLAVRADSRGQGVGRALMLCLLAAAKESGHTLILLNSQLSAMAFYAGLGFVEEGGIYMEAGIPHITMRKNLLA